MCYGFDDLSTMATYNNPHFILSHIRNSFITTDDTGEMFSSFKS